MPRTPRRSSSSEKSVDALTHDEATRINNPTAELASLYEQQQEQLGGEAVRMTVPRARPLERGERRERDGDLDPQLVWNGASIRITKEQMEELAATGRLELGDAQLIWRGKDTADWSDLVVNAPPIYIQEKVKPKAIIEALKKRTKKGREAASDAPDLFADFNGLDDPEDATEFYQHSKHWTNRMILGDSLQVMASLAQREALAGKVQCIYFDPPYGIKFNSNWQVSTLSRDVKDGKAEEITREPEQVKAFRDTWKDGIHSYLTYLRDRLTIARELLTESGSIFVQIGDENVHRVRAVMDEVFGEENSVAIINAVKTTSSTSEHLAGISDSVLFYCKNREYLKYRSLFKMKEVGAEGTTQYKFKISNDGVGWARLGKSEKSVPDDFKIFAPDNLTSQRPPGSFPVNAYGRPFTPGRGYWKTHAKGFQRLSSAGRLHPIGQTLMYRRMLSDFAVSPITNLWRDVLMTGFSEEKTYVVQSSSKIVERCILMATDPGDLVLDPTMGSGTTATVAEQWGRRWITIDTSRVAMALARTRLMSARYPYYLLADSPEGQQKEGEITRQPPKNATTHGDIRQGFVYDRAPHITLKSIANNPEIDEIWERFQTELEPLRERLNAALGRIGERAGLADAGETGPWEEWEIPRHPAEPWDAKLQKEHAKALDTEKSDKIRAKAVKTINDALGRDYTLETLPERPAEPWGEDKALAAELLAKWWEKRIARQREIDASIAARADVEYLYDRPHADPGRVRVAGPFTVESLSPHRVVTARDDVLEAELKAEAGELQRAPGSEPEADFGAMILENLRSAGVHQQDKADRITFSAIEPLPVDPEMVKQEKGREKGGGWLAAIGHYQDGEGREKRAGILIGPEFGTLSRSQITGAAREAADARLDALIACAFNFEAGASDLVRLLHLPIIKARMNPDLHMADDL
ncbi:MAG: site-specific DNA-methyltransferase, partial [Sphingomonas bacterium]|nr:site-specific DNA-methyltransferase [Sphingomonas bacterium]